MSAVIVEQFNPETKCWNKLYEVDSEEFNENEPYKVNKYNGPYRTRVVEEEIKQEWSESDVVFELGPIKGIPDVSANQAYDSKFGRYFNDPEEEKGVDKNISFDLDEESDKEVTK